MKDELKNRNRKIAIELIKELNLIENKDFSDLSKEVNELISIFVSSVKTVKSRVNSIA